MRRSIYNVHVDHASGHVSRFGIPADNLEIALHVLGKDLRGWSDWTYAQIDGPLGSAELHRAREMGPDEVDYLVGQGHQG